jgi:hypothetical protein
MSWYISMRYLFRADRQDTHTGMNLVMQHEWKDVEMIGAFLPLRLDVTHGHRPRHLRVPLYQIEVYTIALPGLSKYFDMDAIFLPALDTSLPTKKYVLRYMAIFLYASAHLQVTSQIHCIW